MADFEDEDDSQGGGGAADASNSESGALNGDNDSAGNDPADAADEARDSFPDTEPDAVTPCEGEPPGAGTSTSTCSADDIKKKLGECDGGTDAWNKAKKAAGKDPVLTVGPTTLGFKAESDSTGAITITPQDCCNAMQSMIMELTNVSHGPEFNKNDSDAANGDVAREDYTKTKEKLEYDGVMTTLTAFDACKSKWGCGPEAKAKFDGFRNKTFDQYYDSVKESHKQAYRDYWDRKYKAAYDKKHPAPAPPSH